MKYGRITKRRRYVRKSKKTSYKKKVIRKVAIQSIRRLSETKKRYDTFSLSPFNGLLNVWNVFYNVGQSTADNGRIGDKISAQYVHLKGLLRGPAATLTQQTDVRVFIFQHRTQANNGLLGNIMTQWIGPPFIKSGSAINGFIDTEKYTVIRDYKIKVTPNNASTQTKKYINIYLPLKNKTVQYDGDNTGFLKFKNTYIGMVFDNNGNTLNDLFFDGSVLLSYKDF